MSLLAATLIAATAMAAEDTVATTEKGAEYAGISNIKVSGDAKLFYSTADNRYTDSQKNLQDGTLFSKYTSTGQVAAKVGVTADLTEGVTSGASIVALSTLGLQGQLVNNVWEATNGVDDSFWFDEAWIAGTSGKTTGKIGRMELDTPLVFSEKWSTVANTFEAAVVINQDIPDTTLVGAYVGGSNGADAINTTTNPGATAGVIADFNANGTTNFHQFYDGAFAIGAENNSWEPLTVQGWYYDAQHYLNSYWLQADLELDFGLSLGGQFTGNNYKKSIQLPIAKESSNTAFAAKIGYEMENLFAISGAFSQIGKDKDNNLGAGSNLSGSGQSKLYTEAWWNYGYITRSDTTAINVTATTPKELTWAQLGVYFTQAKTKDAFVGAKGVEDALFTEVTVEAAKSFGALDVGIYYIMTKADDMNQEKATKKGDAFNTVQAYLTYNF